MAIPSCLKLCIGVVGIYASFLVYGSLWEDILFYEAPDGERFTWSWTLQVFEAASNVVFGGVLCLVLERGPRLQVPQLPYTISGSLQVVSKFCTTAAMVHGVSFPVSMLAKSSKMIPVMIGQIVIGKARYTLREYAAVSLIVFGTAVVSVSKDNKSGTKTSVVGMMLLISSLVCDGSIGGTQKYLKAKLKAANLKEYNFEMQFYTNFYMMLTAVVFCLSFQEIRPAMGFLVKYPEILKKVFAWAVCSATGQGFIFFTITTFDSLVCTTVTTTRKVFSILYSVLTKGHTLSSDGWLGIGLACSGILAELQDKFAQRRALQHEATIESDVYQKLSPPTTSPFSPLRFLSPQWTRRTTIV
eukprot:TRINITY_DN9350_c0_g3_i1.p1 TRINITY_DN9350_c0_g3~~TRINITY_DN9350_c0_g3_i1.p1  ORF type:complete len:357 (+),score=35.14 TRINITY_DN9350_c0_g3_i1:67-1137(+)